MPKTSMGKKIGNLGESDAGAPKKTGILIAFILWSVPLLHCRSCLFACFRKKPHQYYFAILKTEKYPLLPHNKPICMQLTAINKMPKTSMGKNNWKSGRK